MIAQELITSDLPILMPIDSVFRALSLMDEYKVAHLPVVVEDQYKGLINEEELLECDEKAILAEVNQHPFSVDPSIHVYEVVTQMARAEVDVLPVVFQGKYMGSIDRVAVLNFFAHKAGWGLEGSTIILEIPALSFSLAETSRLVEENGATITSYNMSHLDSGDLQITIKLNTVDIASTLATFERFDYKVKTFFNAPEVEDDLRSKFDEFMRYLES